MKKPLQIKENPGLVSVLASVASIAIGLLFGFVLLLILNAKNALPGMGTLLSKGASDFGNVLYRAAPLVMVGLSVAFAYKVGLFNIGGSGQYTVGAFLALLLGIKFQMPWYVCLLAAAVGGAVWGIFPGLFKALFNVNEVLTAIMFNWIAMNLVNLLIPNVGGMLDSDWGATSSDRTALLANANPKALSPRMGLDKLFGHPYMNVGIFLAIILAIILWVVLKKTTFGYELKACGFNRDASTYAGINAKRDIVLSMVIAGAMAGIGGGLFYLAGGGQYNLIQQIESAGFDGISVALLANCNPIGCIFTATFLSYLRLGGNAMQSQGFATETTEIVTSVIVYLAAFSLLLRMFLSGKLGKTKKREKKEAA